MSAPSLTPAQRYGPVFRARRVGLGLRGDELGLPRSVYARLHRIEDGDEEPRCGWWEMKDAIYKALLRRIADHVKNGGNLDQLIQQVRGWPAQTLYDEYITAKADLEIEAEQARRTSN